MKNTQIRRTPKENICDLQSIIQMLPDPSTIGCAAAELLSPQICDSLNLDELKALVERAENEVRRKKVLSQYEIKQFNTGLNAGKFYVKIDGKKHQSTTRSGLEKIILEHHRGLRPKEEMTFKAIFLQSMDYRLSIIQDPEKLASSKNTVDIHKRNYRRFIQGTPFEKKQIDEITKRDITDLLDMNLKRFEMKKHAFKNLKTVLNKTFNYALKLELIEFSPMLSVFWDDYKDCFAASAPIKQRGYTDDEMNAMYDFARKMQEIEPDNTRWWSYEFNLLTAMRRAEIPPLRWSDVYFEQGYIDVHQELIGVKKPYLIKQSTKTDKDRYFPITAAILAFLARLAENNNRYHPGSSFLFPDENEELGCITPNVTYRAHKKTCKHLGIRIDKEFPKGTHAFRRVHETSFLENGGTLDLASKVYGNSPGVIDSNYLLSVNARSSASVIDMTQQRLFKAISKNRSQMAESLEKSTIATDFTEVNKVNAMKKSKREA